MGVFIDKKTYSAKQQGLECIYRCQQAKFLGDPAHRWADQRLEGKTA